MPILTFSGDFVASQFSLDERNKNWTDVEVQETPFLSTDIIRIEIDDRDVQANGEFDHDLVRFLSFSVERGGVVYDFGVDSGSKIKESGGGSAKEQGDTYFSTNDSVAPPSSGPFSGLEEQTYLFSSDTSFAGGPGNYSMRKRSNDEPGDRDGNFNTASAAVCCAAGTRILTAQGPQPIEDVTQGALVKTLDRGYVPVRHVLKHHRFWSADPDKDKPILIATGALGKGLPQAPLILSPQHRMLMPRPDGGAYLTAARHLCGLRGVRKMRGLRGVRQMRGLRHVSYVHLVLDHHAILFAEGAPSESFYPGAVAMRSLPVSDYRAVEVVFGRLDGRTPIPHARPTATGQQTRRLLKMSTPLWTAERLLQLQTPDHAA